MPYISTQDLFRFISPDEIKVYCGFSPNVRNETITAQIQLAQNLKLQVILGKTLYEELKAEFILANGNPNLIVDGTTNANGVDYKTLYFTCFPVLVWYTAWYSVSVIGVKLEEKGIMLNDSDYADNAAFNGLKLKEDRIRKTAEEYTEQLYCYLKETFKDDVEFNAESKNEGRRFSGVYFPVKTNKSCTNC